MTHEREGEAAKVTTSAEAGDDHIGIFTSHLHLLLCLQSDDGLVESYVVEYRTQRIFTIRCCRCQFYSLRDSCTQRTWVHRVFGDDVLTGTGGHRGRCCDGRSEGTHHAGAIGLLLHGDLHLIDSCIKSKQLGGIGERHTPLTGTRLCGHIGCAFLLGIVALGQGRVDFM